MDDKGRYLEQLSLQVQRLTLVEVQKAFLSGEVQYGANMLSQWEHYQDIIISEHNIKKNETLSTTVQFFSKRVIALQNVLRSLPNQQCVRGLQEKLNILDEKFASDKIGVGGGTFEWVDSVLVKCLQEGSWLMIDNVNLCSSAVLDRLNGLLEPDGELVLGERGVRADGQLVTIKPHSDFKLFLVMDPRFGEISRAMRNRGVELCLLDPEEKPAELMDLQAILCHIGISHYKYQKAQINIYQEMKNLQIGFEAITISHLFRAASLTMQQTLRGRPFIAALFSACSDVYIQSRQLSLDQRERCELLLSEICKDQEKLLNRVEKNAEDALDTKVVTLGTLPLQENSTVTILKQRCALLSSTLKLLEHPENYILKNLFNDSLSEKNSCLLDKKLIDVVPYILLSLVSSVSENDASLRQSIITETIMTCTSIELRDSLLELEKHLISIIQHSTKTGELSNVGLQQRDLCWDLRRVSPWIVDTNSCDYENKIIVLLYYYTQHLQLNVKLGDMQSTTVKNMSALDFSTAYNKGKVSLASVNDPIILNLSRFLEVLAEQIHQLIKSRSSLNERQSVELICACQWVHRLLRLSQQRLFTLRRKEMLVSEELTTLLELHVGWTKKCLFPLLTRLLNRHTKRKDSGKLPPQLTEMCSTVSSMYPIRSLSKKVRLLSGQPKPLSYRLQGEISEELARLEEILDLTSSGQSREVVQRKVEFLLSVEGKRLRSKMAEAFMSIHTTEDLQQVLEQLKQLEFSVPTRYENESIKGIDKDSALMRKHASNWSWEVVLWPVKGIFCLKLMSAFRNNATEQLKATLYSWLCSLPFISTRLMLSLDNNQMANSTLLMQQLSRSLVVNNPRAWMNWESLYEPIELEEGNNFFDQNRADSSVSYPLNTPLVALFTTSLLFPSCHNNADHSLALPSLRSNRQHSRLLNELADTVWACGPALATASINYRKNEAESIEKSYSEFLKSMEKALKLKMSNKELSSHEKDIFELLEDLIKTKQLLPFKLKDNSKEVEELMVDLGRYVETIEISLRKLNEEEKENLKWLWIGQTYTYSGLLRLKLFALQNTVDPVQKRAIKLQYCIEEHEELERSLAVEQAQGLILGSCHFPLANAFTHQLELLSTKKERLRKFVAERPQPNVYSNLYNEIQQLMAVIVNPNRRVEVVAGTLRDCVIKEAVAGMGVQEQEAVSRAQALITSLLRSMDTLSKRYGTWYPDVVVPVVSAIGQITHGLSLIISCVRKHGINVEATLRVFARFPLPDQAAALELIQLCTSTRTLDLLQAAATPKLGQGLKASNKTFRLAKLSLQEMCNIISVKGRIEVENWSVICRILDHLVVAWQQQEQQKAMEEQQESSFFINKPRKIENLTEEEEDALEMRKLFPSSREKDFADLEPPSLETKKEAFSEDDSEDPELKLSIENVLEIHKVHSELVTKNTRAHWIGPKDRATPDFVTPFMERFTVFSVLLDSVYAGCDSELDAAAVPALSLGVSLARAHGTINEHVKRKHYYFYHDANINEVKLCLPILDSLSKRVFELLEEWPDHPTLNQIILVINRILDFPSQSPVSRFLVGFELLLTKLKEWEENAHSGVTLGPHATAVTRQVLDWRKLELTQWKGCLETARIRLCEGSISKWWFHLYGLVREHAADTTQLTAVLERFMESSNMAEYQTRLDLLYTFHCHCVNSQLIMQSHVLWNVHQYYAQFSRVIARRIKELSQPVEKKLKDFVKIARWNDINYWAVKETVTKTHRALFKYIREFERILKQPARTAMTKLDPVNSMSTSRTADPKFYMAPLSLAEMLSEGSFTSVEGESQLIRERSLFTRARKLCRDSVTNCLLPTHISALGNIVEELQEVSELLNTEDVDRTVSKDKQKSAARSVLHRKRKALSDLFHSLAGLGLSYRAGLVTTDPQETMFSLHTPFNVFTGLAQIDNRPADKELLKAWSGCDEHFLHSVAHLAQLKTALAKPHKDLGPAVIERCKGFSYHLMSVCHEQKKSVARSVSSLYVLRCLTQYLTCLQPGQANLTRFKDDLLLTLEDIIYCLEQFDVLMDACPGGPEVIDLEGNVQVSPAIPDSTELLIYKGNEHWTTVKTKLAAAVKTTKKTKTSLEARGKYSQFLETLSKTNENPALDHLLKYEDLDGLKEGFSHLAGIKHNVGEIVQVFRMKVDSDVNPMVHSLNHLIQKIEKSLESFSCFYSTIKDHHVNLGTDFDNVVETFLNKVLFTIQEFYKKHPKKEDETTETLDTQQNQFVSELFDFHLKEKIIAELQNELKLVKLTEITEELLKVILLYKDNKLTDNSTRRCVPLLHQYSLMAQFVITQQVAALHSSSHLCSSLLAVFVDLANKGFLVPEELLEEEDGEGAETTTGGMGLGEGEGEKDVSDQIESQDQLEDAKKPGEHDQEEDKDCKEEENGIEMSDDFGGQLQDIDRKEDEDRSGEESGEEEPDKEMGDTEKGAETLDEQIWGGSDSEEEEDEVGDMKEEEGDRGEQTGEKEVGAKDDSKTPQADKEDRQGSEEKNEKKKEINEMEEPEVDDDQVDPYHGKNQPQPEPEPLDLPEDLHLDEGDRNDKDDEGEEENPFDIDAMKEPKLPEEEENPDGGSNELTEKDNDKDENPDTDSSDEDGEGEGENEETEPMDVDETEKSQEEDKSTEDGGAKDENKTGEEANMEDDKNEDGDSAKPSEDLPASEPVPSSEQETGSKDQVKQPESSDQSKELSPDESAAEGPDEQGVGAAHNQQRESQRGSQGESNQAIQSQSQELREEKRERPGDREDQRALGDSQEPMKKKLKTINIEKESQRSQESIDDEGVKEDQSAELYQHIKEAKETCFDAQTLDAATEEQAAEQKIPNKEDEKAEALKEDTDMTMDQDEPSTETENITSVNPEKLKEASKDKKEGAKQPSAEGDKIDSEAKMEVEGEIIPTMTVERGSESTFYTKLDDLSDVLSSQNIEKERKELEQQLSTWSQPPANEEAAKAWERLSNVTADLSRELSEQLRLVLEPTHASRLKGDFRTGRRINMRKVIPYIASQFRKDKIWLRRTKPAKREYQIVLAVDDSSSMADNHSKELAFESLSVVSKALSLLEAGQLAVLSFGEQPKILHQLGDQFTEHCGARLLQQFSFEQQKTHVGALVNFACNLFARNPPRRGVTDIAQLLVIVSDGRGVLSDGEEVVRQAVRRAKHMGIFMVFVIVDNPQSKDSILDIRLPKFSGGKLLGIVPYMDSFPFPFYLILRDINSLPSVLSDALRQWFELVTTTA